MSEKKTIRDLMGAAFDATAGVPPRIRGMALARILEHAIEGRAKVGRGDFEEILGSWLGVSSWRPSGMAQFFRSAEELHTLAVRSRNTSAAGDLERYLGRAPWWWDGPTPEDLGRLRLFVGAKIRVCLEGVARPALVTQIGSPRRGEDDALRLKIAPAGDWHFKAACGFALRKLDREGLAELLEQSKGGPRG